MSFSGMFLAGNIFKGRKYIYYQMLEIGKIRQIQMKKNHFTFVI
jgi:hypothetical protein